jgi:hypothetical protein
MKWRDRIFECDGLTWDELTDRLVEFLTLRARSDHRIVTLVMSNYYRWVQLRASPAAGFLRCETISNHFLTQSDRLPRSIIAALSAIGWKAPRRHERHFWREYKAGTKPIQPAAFAIRTLRDVFGASDPAALQIWCGAASMGGIIQLPTESSIDLPVLAKGSEVTNLTTGAVYRVGKRLGHGGFGAVYRVTRTRPAREFRGKLCLKVAARPEAWHREAYFGELLEGQPRAIAVHDSFAILDDGPYSGERPLYCLVTELAAHGDLVRYLQRRSRPWTEARACREICEILRVLVHLHEAGAVHRDLTPLNVLVAEGEHLKLGDFGIARHRLQGRSVQADIFNRAFAPPTVADGSTSSWRAADDVYQIGLILTALLGGSADERADSAEVRDLECSPGLKAVIQRAIGDRRKRYKDAAAMLEAIRRRHEQRRRRVPLPGSLRAKFIVFTGALSMPRRAAVSLAKRSGARVQPKITSRTDIVVKGSPAKGAKMWKAEAMGQKLLDVERERERGHEICVINEREFRTLVPSMA